MENAENVPQGSPEQEPISSLPTTEEALSGTEATQKELKQSTSELQTQPTDEHPLKPNGGHSPQPSKRNETPANEFQYANQGYEQEDPELGDISSNNTTTVVISQQSDTAIMVPSLQDYMGMSYSSLRTKGKAPEHIDYQYDNKAFAEEPEQSDIANNNNTTKVVISQPHVTAVVTPPLQDYMGLSFCACLCCFLIGLCACTKSSMARTLHEAGYYDGAATAGRSARSLSMIAIAIGLCGIVLVAVFIGAHLAG